MRTMFIGVCLASLAACGDSGATSTTSGSTSEAAPSTTGATTGEPTTGTGATTGTTTGTTTGETTTGQTATGDTTSSPSPTSSTTGDASTGTASTTEPDDTTTTDPEDTTGGATSPLVIAVVDAYLVADCTQPTPDPVQGGWYVEFDNVNNLAETSVILKSASLSLLDADPPVLEPITVQPTESGPLPAGEYVSQEMIKLPGAAHSACDHCGEFYMLVLEYDEAGYIHHVDEEMTIQCD
ncbi:MAG TPA: hypothetical protein VGB85_21315 [Nannocystis sp.]